jgi:hypothetical protein
MKTIQTGEGSDPGVQPRPGPRWRVRTTRITVALAGVSFVLDDFGTGFSGRPTGKEVGLTKAKARAGRREPR